MSALIPHARLHVYHGGHLALVTEAAELARLQARIERGAQVVAVLLLLAAGAMAVARYL